MKPAILLLSFLLATASVTARVSLRKLETDQGVSEEGGQAGHGDQPVQGDEPEQPSEETEGEQAEEPHEEEHEDGEGEEEGEGEPEEEQPEEGEEGEPEEQEQEPLEEVPQEITLEENSADELERNFRKIAADLKGYEEAYKMCVDAIKDVHYDAAAVEECVGRDYVLLVDDIWYLKRKLVAQSESALRRRFVEQCYGRAAGSVETSEACDLVEKDAIRMLRQEVDFPLLLGLNRQKYESMYAKMDGDFLDALLGALKPIYAELDQLLEELYDHKFLTIAAVKRYVDDRTEKVRAKYAGGEINAKPKLKRTKMVVTSTLHAPPHYHIDLDRLPRPVLLNGAPKTYAVRSNPYVEKWLNNVGPQRFSEVNNPVEPVRDWDPDIAVGFGKDDYRKRKG